MLPTLSLPAGAALGGLPLPEGGEEARADTPVGTRGARGGNCTPGKTSMAWDRLTTPWGCLWATCGSCDVCREWSGRQDLPCSVSGPAIPLYPFPREPNFNLSLLCHPVQSHHCPHNVTPPQPSVSALPAVCPASPFSLFQELN